MIRRRALRSGRAWGAHVWRLACLVVAALPPSVRAQSVQATAIEDGNGQFDFWLPAWKRPDTELTNSLQARLTFASAAIWGGWFNTPACGQSLTANRCGTTELSLGQEMYTPRSAIWTSRPQPGQRSYAGWLYVASTARLASSTASDALTLQLGVTGRPSLAEQVQTAWHSLIGYPRALGWAHQIPFQPGIMIAGEHATEIARLAINGVPVMSVTPHASVAVGNVLTGASAGVDLRAGFGVTPTWSHATPGRARRLELYALGSIQEDLVIYRLVLDQAGSGLNGPVSKLPLVNQYTLGAGARVGPLEVEYRGIMRGREYVTGPTHNPFGVLVLGIRPGW
jgi:hypothetical protein